jgi:hypothetical protein
MPPYNVPDVETRRRATELLEQGLGSWAVAKQMKHRHAVGGAKRELSEKLARSDSRY